MKICIISTLFRPLSRGGAELVAERVVDGLMAQGHEVFVISLNTYRPWNIASFQNLAKLPAFIRPLWHILDMFNLHTFFVVRRILKKEKPDLVLSHNIKGLGYTVPRAVASTGIPYAHTLHDVQLVEPSGLIMATSPQPSPCEGEGVRTIPLLAKERLGEVFHSVYTKITRTLFGSPTMIISPSKFLMDFYASRGFFKNSKKLVLPNPAPPIILSSYHPSASTTLHLLYVSQLHPSRGILFLVDTLKTWQQPFHLTIVGTGACEAMVRKELQNDIRFTMKGFIPNDKLGSLYQDADALILPSLCVENAPLTITDALASGVPVIASHIGGIPEMIQEGANGLTFEPRSAKDLLEKLSKIKNLKPQTTQLPTIKEYLQTLLEAYNQAAK